MQVSFPYLFPNRLHLPLGNGYRFQDAVFSSGIIPMLNKSKLICILFVDIKIAVSIFFKTLFSLPPRTKVIRHSEKIAVRVFYVQGISKVQYNGNINT